MRAAGEPVDLVGHSYGALCALGAAAMEPALVKHLVLYEPADRDLPGLEVVARFGQGDDSDALAMFLTEVAGEPRERVEELKKTPVWPYMLRFTSSAPFEGPALLGYDFNPANFAHVKAQALFLVGSETKEQLGRLLRELNTVMPAQWHTFEGQGHGAITAAPGEFSETVLEFLSR
jgi:pimeloyl-ACP methyl ester carboxylesterase